ncbi:DUF3560 domain-containing protein [Prescottella subtropica]|uniref:DUF3560 domain-containing protein n=1 Tax=Prescottella subtropica TaxID=2545757 RepID=UPI0010F9C7BC|nr:DUF3560 domain-containing protein [Prescottella subtropica]
MSALTITHTHADGALIDGTARGDGTAPILKANRWRWSRNLGSWYIQNSRDRHAKLHQINATAEQLRAAGFTVEIEIDDTYSQVADVEADKIARQQGRVDALDAKADRKADAAAAAWAADKAATAALPEGGEPVKVGHHSEGRHRRAIEKSWNALGKAVHAERDAATARGRADAAAKTTDHRYAPVTVARRIDKLAAELRRLERTRDGYTRTLYTNSQTGQKYVETHAPADGAHRDRVLAEIDHTADELAYWQGVRAGQIDAGTVSPYSRDVVAVGDQVRYVGTWHEIRRVNAKSVTIGSIVGGSWTDRIPYTEIRGLRDADGNTVRVVDGQRVIEAPAETADSVDAA